MNPLLAQLTHRPFPDVAAAIRNSADQITHAWDSAVRIAMPQMQNPTFDELKDSTPQILVCIADALASGDPATLGELIDKAPLHVLSRVRLHFDVVEVMQEDRLLRSITVQHAEAWLNRRMDEFESAALHAAIDVMLQRSVIAIVNQQKKQLRVAAETELKFLSFLSHDLNNNLNSVMLLLQALGLDLRQAGGFSAAEASLESAQLAIHGTVGGMRRMLNHAQLRQTGKASAFVPVGLYAAAQSAISQFQRQADTKGVKLRIDVRPGTVVESDPELLAIILQNLVGNAVKYSSSGCVSIGFEIQGDSDSPTLWVSDEGPGIDPDQATHLFDAFSRGEAHGQHGLGLGLAIASQAAKLLGATLSMDSKHRVGTTFSLTLPATPRSSTKPAPAILPLAACT